MDIKQFVNEILVLDLGEELVRSIVGHFNVRFKSPMKTPSIIHGAKLEEILIEVFKRLKIIKPWI